MTESPKPTERATDAPDYASMPRRGLFGQETDAKPRWERRRERIRSEIERNRRGDFKVPTWLLAVLLVAFVAGWAALIVFTK